MNKVDQFSNKSRVQKCMHDMKNLTQRLTDAWAGVEDIILLLLLVSLFLYCLFTVFLLPYIMVNKDVYRTTVESKTFLSNYRQFLDIYLSQGSVATRIRCTGFFDDASLLVYCRVRDEILLKISQRMAKLWGRVICTF